MTTQGTTAAVGRTSLPQGDALLRLALKLDAAVTGLNGAAYLAGASVLAEPLGLSAGLLRGVGAFLVAYAAGVWLVATRDAVRPAAAWTVVALNAVWAADSLAVAALGWGSPTALGAVWIVLQAVVVAGFAALQRAGLRQRA